MKTIDRTKPQVTSLELSRKITEALEGIGVRVETYWAHCVWKYGESIDISETLRVGSDLECSEKIPAYTSDDLMALLPDGYFTWKNEGKYLVTKIFEKDFPECDSDIAPEALGKLLVYLIEEGVINE